MVFKIVLFFNVDHTLYAKAFQQAIKENGEIECSVVQCMPIGPPQVGKTHFHHRLLDIDYENKKSTGVMAEKGMVKLI